MSRVNWKVPDGISHTLEEFQAAYLFDTRAIPPPDLDLIMYGKNRIEDLKDLKEPSLADYGITFWESSAGPSMGDVLRKSIQIRMHWQNLFKE